MSKYTTRLIFAFTVFTTTTGNLSAAEGKALYTKNCTGCHGTEVFTRADRRVKNMAALKSRVQQCSYAVESNWFDEEVALVADYLNKNFYKF